MNDYNGLKVGSIFTIVSMLLTITIIVPAFSLIPGAIVEGIVSAFVDNEPYSNVGRVTIIVMSVIFAIMLIATIYYVRKQVINDREVTKIKIALIMAMSYLIVHPLVFYIYWAIKLDYRSDGQLIMGSFYTFPISSLWFFILGLIIDLVISLTENRKSY
ncbi:hypothetical protein M2451_003288 [Dysgonomonas sp. PFB1-18]|uniref:hypothetical protein n=1 Tax=unclassified Dysgonomonas TaxID=2630389 RepID=UPI002475D716|nr:MULTISPECIES: hypothetical protein [unclassified Dysgonomonas]MDH6310401.1 hypothetical protein [Dysgonomonas sp. PF1-14]MDH6340269.1 hypothetical protein [Dysgonomonas sp. PF1-16]MDH6381951.1 hypothetical protein [Dysgonomonas sp. PFB1-18]MDH6399240.1 hypothetical protein [Dysgonomonas sp. PF1-23]